MDRGAGIPQSQALRAHYFFQDPIRLGAIVCATLLLFVRNPPVSLTLLAIGLSQFNGLTMIVDWIGRGWSRKGGRKIRSAAIASHLAQDWANMSLCTLVGAMLLMRFFGPPQLVTALGILALALGFLPDIRVCRMILPGDPREAARHLDRGYFFRDPVKLGGLLSLVILCALDRTSLVFIFASMALLQFNAVVLLLDKYVAEIEAPARPGVLGRSAALRLLMAREGQRFLLALLPFLFVPFRLAVDETASRWAAGLVAAAIILPDLFRIAGRALSTLLGLAWSSPPPARPA